MEKYGMIIFGGVQHAGKVDIDENNHIIITIFESDMHEPIDEAIGEFDGAIYIINKMVLIDNGIGFYKMQAKYICKSHYTLNFRKNENKRFRFKFYRLREWLNIHLLNNKDDIVKINIPKKIFLLKNEKMQIYIKYYREIYDENDSNTSEYIEYIPYIVVESNDALNVNDICVLIQKITRFFAILIGHTDNVNKILIYEGTINKKFDVEHELYINSNFTNNYGARYGYSMYNLRTEYCKIRYTLKESFSKWMDLLQNENYNRVVTQYYSYYRGINIEENFLAIIRSIEELYELKHESDNKEKEIRIISCLTDFYSKNEDKLKSIFSTSISCKNQKKYVDKIKDIHNEVINNFIDSYNMRKTISDKIKELDEGGLIQEIYKKNHIINENQFKNIYDSVARTRNYYTHLSSRNENIIDDNYLDRYSRVLEKILVKELMKLIGMSKSIIDNALQMDRFLNTYNTIDSSE